MQVVLLTLLPFTASAKEEWVKFAKFECDPNGTFSINWIPDHSPSLQNDQSNINRAANDDGDRKMLSETMYQGYVKRPVAEETVVYECKMADKVLKAEIVFSKEYKFTSFDHKSFQVNGDTFRVDPTFRVRIWQKNLFPAANASLKASRKHYREYFLLMDILRNEEPISTFQGAEIVKHDVIQQDWKVSTYFLEPYRIYFADNTFTICGERYFNGREDFGFKDCKKINTENDFLITKKDLQYFSP